MGYPWWVFVLLFIVIGGAGVGGGWVWKQVRPGEDVEREYVDRNDTREPMVAVEGFTRRWAQLQADFMRRVGGALAVLCVLIACALGINVTLYSAQREDDAQQARQVETNRSFLDRLNTELRDRRERAARTDRQQCEDIERLKSNARASAQSGRKTVRALAGLSEADKAALIAASVENERLFMPRRVIVNGKLLEGLDACGALPNATGTP